ncbi:MAG: helix-turn-helix transcriptional regulator [Desulfarculus sp.]|nr:helix-turn-helix transcriptional regulator [Pseudomonadota bacterium]MBV1717708.1 helix-turn-helix transcriptional regulator [Desulfarculus sp.]MBU4577148.1 helix-turn-helix transcriptional regulator [Pseudomonadota bacterium]MBU4596942.1 helix-turn-helix transcriptional regulator [Pseudomonadota bacterium]MBV1738563.1 helix-turn-helix transcriptional regulator [Desulfarculus sp.]
MSSLKRKHSQPADTPEQVRSREAVGSTGGTSLSDFSSRLRVVLSEFKSTYAFAKKAGVSQGGMQKWIKGQSEPGRDKLIALSEAANVRLEWLATGQGPMRDGGKDDSSIGTDTISIPCYDLQTLTGHSEVKGGLSAPPKHFAFQSAWLRDKTGLNHEDLLLVKVVGDAMEPTLKQGDVVLANRAKAHVPDDGLYVLIMDGTMLVKRLRKRPGRKVQVISDNGAYGSFDLDLADPPEDMTIIGRVVWFGREI